VRASSRSCASDRNAVSTSPSLAAWRTCTNCPRVRAASCTSLASGFKLLGFHEHGDLAGFRQQFAQQLQALRTKCDGEKRHSGQIAARTAEIGDEAGTHRICADREYDRNGCRRGFSGDSRNVTSTGNEDRRPARHEFGGKRGETVELTFGPTIIDRHVLAIDITGLGKTLPERRYHG